MSFGDDLDFPVECPNCKRELTKKLGRLYRDKRIDCPACGPIEITGDGLRRIETAFKDLQRQFSKLGGTIKIKL